MLQGTLKAAVYGQNAKEDGRRSRECWTLQRMLDAAECAQNTAEDKGQYREQSEPAANAEHFRGCSGCCGA